MSWTPPGRGELRERVRFEMRGPKANVGGVVRDGWVVFCPDRRVRLLPVRGGEVVQGARATGVSMWNLDVPADVLVRQLTTSMRVVDCRDETRVWDIRSVLDLEGKNRWRTLTVEMGTADGR
jgi:hypothetical protein